MIEFVLCIPFLKSNATTDIHHRYQNLRHLDPCMGLNMGVFGFSHNQNNRGSSSACVTCMYCGMNMETNAYKTCAAREDREHICFAFACACVVSKNLKTLELSSIADNAITVGGIGCLGSLVYICECNSPLSRHLYCDLRLSLVNSAVDCLSLASDFSSCGKCTINSVYLLLHISSFLLVEVW